MSAPRRAVDERVATVLGAALGVGFVVCSLTGLYSHLAQHPPSWFVLPPRPAGLYRVTQGLHVATGIACVPLLLAKLWSVRAGLVAWPPAVSVAHALERLSLVPLVAGGLFLLWTGVANIDLWYPLPFFFPAAHHWVAWITVGALIVHAGAKAGVVRRAVTSGRGEGAPVTERRRFLTAAAGASGLLVASTVGMTVRSLERAALLAPRRPSTGPQGFPVNGAAAEAGVVEAATDPGWALEVSGRVARPGRWTLAELRAMPQHEAVLPIACVEGWSATARWRGVPLRDLLEAAGAPGDAEVTVRSVEDGLYARSDVNRRQARDADTLLALDVNGEPLHLDHGYPCRLIGPNRPGVLQTKWLRSVEVR